MNLRPRALAPAAVGAKSGSAPDDAIDEVAGPPFSPTEAAAAIALGLIALLIAGLMGLLLAALAVEVMSDGLVKLFPVLATGLR